jgi:hypothetical protein
MNEFPVSGTALRILLRLGGVIEGKLNVVKGTNFAVCQDSDAMTIGSYGELDGSCMQVSQYRFEVRMQAILSGPQID